jgi:hypothetical protein
MYTKRNRRPLSDSKILHLYQLALEVFEDAYIELLPLDPPVTFKATNMLGQCEYRHVLLRSPERKPGQNPYQVYARIGINDRITNERRVWEVILHELCHAAKQAWGQGHNWSWKFVASVIRGHTYVDIKREADNVNDYFVP